MGGEAFQDYYELLQVSPNADEDTIHRVFRHLAKRYHPDTAQGDTDQFNRLLAAYRTLTDPEARAAYDVRHQQHWERTLTLANDAPEGRVQLDDDSVRERLLSLCYLQRRRNVRNPGLGEVELARLVGCPADLIEFHLWYLREKGWIARLESGAFAITAEGVDRLDEQRPRLNPERLIETRVAAAEGDEAAPAPPTDRKSASR